MLIVNGSYSDDIYNIYSQNTVKPSDSGGSIRVFSYILIPESNQPHGILDTGYRIQDTGYRIQDTGCRIYLDA